MCKQLAPSAVVLDGSAAGSLHDLSLLLVVVCPAPIFGLLVLVALRNELPLLVRVAEGTVDLT